MASFMIHEDQENSAAAARKDNEVFPTAAQRRALGDLSQFACNQNRSTKFALPSQNQTTKTKDENKLVRQINNEKNIAPPVAQFRAFSVYEDKPNECEPKKKEPIFKPFSSVELRRSSEVSNVENARIALKTETIPDRPAQVQPLAPRLQEKTEDAFVESPMSVTHDSSVLSVMSVSRNETQLEEVEESEEEEAGEVTVAQTDREMFFHVVEYRDDIYKYMREIEEKHQPSPRYMRKQPDISHSMRAILVDWLAEVCEEYSQQSETLHLAVSYVDRFLSYMSVVRAKLQLVGTAATFIAAKYEEVYPPDVGEFVYITDDTYTKREVLRMEHLILKVLSFDLSTPTALAFLSHYCISNSLSKKTFHLASYIAELSLLEADPYLQFKPSVIAASALATARHCLLCRRCAEATDSSRDSSPHADCLKVAWSTSLAQSSGYQVSELEPCLRELARTHAHAPLQPRRAIPDKYQTNKLEAVSTIEARPMFPVPDAPAVPPSETTPASAPAPTAATLLTSQPQRVS